LFVSIVLYLVARTGSFHEKGAEVCCGFLTLCIYQPSRKSLLVGTINKCISVSYSTLQQVTRLSWNWTTSWPYNYY